VNDGNVFLPTDVDVQSIPDLTRSEVERSVAAWLKSYLADLLEFGADEIDEEKTFDRFGLDSLTSVAMVGDLEEWLGYELDPAAPNEHPSIGSLSRELAADDRLRAAFANKIGASQ
jgi:acyl carrier protein